MTTRSDIHAPLASPSWHKLTSHCQCRPVEDRTPSAPPLGGFILADLPSNEGISMICSNKDQREQIVIPAYFSEHDEDIEWLQVPQNTTEAHQEANFRAQTSPRSKHTTRNYYQCPQRAEHLPEYVPWPYIARTISNQFTESMTNTVAPPNLLQWKTSQESLISRTISFTQNSPNAPMTSSYSSCSESPTDAASSKTPAPSTAIYYFSPGTYSDFNTSTNGKPDEIGYKGEFQTPPVDIDSLKRRHRHPSCKYPRKQLLRLHMRLENIPSRIQQAQFKCTETGCKGYFRREAHLKRHMNIHSKEKPHVCWVPGCHREFSRSDNLNAHYTKTHSKRGGRNRYVASLDDTSKHYDPSFRGRLTPNGYPVYGSKLDGKLT